jgi:hypothetical protein
MDEYKLYYNNHNGHAVLKKERRADRTVSQSHSDLNAMTYPNSWIHREVDTYLDKKWIEKTEQAEQNVEPSPVKKIVFSKSTPSTPPEESSSSIWNTLNSFNSLLLNETKKEEHEEEKEVDNCKLRLNQIFEETKRKSVLSKSAEKVESTPPSLPSNYVEIDIKDIISNVLENYKSFIPMKNATFGIHKTIFTEQNSIFDVQRNSFRLESQSPTLYSSFYLYPSQTSFIHKMDVNIIEEKKVERFVNRWNPYDNQIFPLHFIPTGIFIPIVQERGDVREIQIESIHWNIFQLENTSSSAIVGMVANQTHFVQKPVSLQLHLELHTQKKEVELLEELYPYEEERNSDCGSRTCVFPVETVRISTMEGTLFQKIKWKIPPSLFQNMLLAIRVSVPDETISTLRGMDVYQQVSMGYIPFHQFHCFVEYSIKS